MDVRYDLNGVAFVWDSDKAATNVVKHGGVTFEQAATVFFDPFFCLVDATRNDEERQAVIGYDAVGRMLFVVHLEVQNDVIRIISARRATGDERRDYEYS